MMEQLLQTFFDLVNKKTYSKLNFMTLSMIRNEGCGNFSLKPMNFIVGAKNWF